MGCGTSQIITPEVFANKLKDIENKKINKEKLKAIRIQEAKSLKERRIALQQNKEREAKILQKERENKLKQLMFDKYADSMISQIGSEIVNFLLKNPEVKEYTFSMITDDKFIDSYSSTLSIKKEKLYEAGTYKRIHVFHRYYDYNYETRGYKFEDRSYDDYIPGNPITKNICYYKYAFIINDYEIQNNIINRMKDYHIDISITHQYANLLYNSYDKCNVVKVVEIKCLLSK